MNKSIKKLKYLNILSPLEVSNVYSIYEKNTTLVNLKPFINYVIDADGFDFYDSVNEGDAVAISGAAEADFIFTAGLTPITPVCCPQSISFPSTSTLSCASRK